MELFTAVFGLAMIYAFIHAIVICFKKLQGLTKYEEVVCWVALSFFVLLMISIR
jgi:hypothetical protein